MKRRPGCYIMHCVLFILLSFCVQLIRADVTLYGLPAFEGAFLTEEFQQTSIAVGFDGAITVVDPAATDPITAHGTYQATYVQNKEGNGIVYQAGGPVYTEYASCAIDPKAGKAECTLSESIFGEGIKTEEFSLTSLSVISVLQVPTATNGADIGQSANTASLGEPTVKTDTSSSKSTGLPMTTLIGIIVGIGAAVLLVIAGLVYCIVLRRQRSKDLEKTGGSEYSGPPQHQPVFVSVQPVTVASERRNSAVYTPHASNSPTTSVPSIPSIPAADTKGPHLFPANPDPSLPVTPAPESNNPSSNVTIDEARQILEEMRRMRIEVETLSRPAVPPEYSA